MSAVVETVSSSTEPKSIAERVSAIAWKQVLQDLDAQGNAKINRLLTTDECQSLSDLYENEAVFRSTVVMQRYAFGRGEYRYFNYPLPNIVASLRSTVYPHLVRIANRWNEAMRIDVRYPEQLADYVERCHQAGQKKPTPLMLRYRAGDYNCLHQDLYGEHVFPFQLTIQLSEPNKDFSVGQFVMIEQRARTQSRLH